MSRDVFIAGAAIEPFGKHRGTATEELGYLAVSRLMATAGLEAGLVDIGFGGSVYGGSLLAQRVLQRVGISGQPVFTVENACASGASAVNLGWQAVASGSADCAIAFGAENLSSFGGGTLPLTTNDIEIAQGMVMPAAYAMRAQRYLHDSGADVESLTNVSVKNRRNGVDNPRAHFQKEVTSEDVENSRPVADPLRLLHCCPNSDGAAAIVLCSEQVAARLPGPHVRVAASVVRSGRFSTGYRDMTWPEITERAAGAAVAHPRPPRPPEEGPDRHPARVRVRALWPGDGRDGPRLRRRPRHRGRRDLGAQERVHALRAVALSALRRARFHVDPRERPGSSCGSSVSACSA